MLDAVGTRDVVVIGVADGGAVAVSFAVRHPDRVRALALYSVPACGRQRPGHPWGPTAEMLEESLARGDPSESMVLGGDLVFEERGRHTLKGVPGEWSLLALRRAVRR